MNEQLNDLPHIPYEEVGGPQHPAQNAEIGHGTIMDARPAGTGTVAEIIDGQRSASDFAAMRHEYGEGLEAQRPQAAGQTVDARHEAVQDLPRPEEK